MVIDSNLIVGFKLGLGLSAVVGLIVVCFVAWQAFLAGYTKGCDDTLNDQIKK